MRLRDLEVGGLYTFKRSAGWPAWHVGFLLDTEPWVNHYSQGWRRASDVDVGDPRATRPRVRCVPLAELLPLVRLRDGTLHEIEFGPNLQVPGMRSYSASSAVELNRIECTLRPTIESLSLIAKRIG